MLDSVEEIDDLFITVAEFGAAAVLAFILVIFQGGGPAILYGIPPIKDISPAWTAYVADKVRQGDFDCSESHYARIGDVHSVWIGSYPYAYGVHPDHDVMPDAATVYALHAALAECIERRLARAN